MAGNKINTKKKDDKNRGARIGHEGDEIDFSLLRKPVKTNITGFAQAMKIFDQATEELKSLLKNECDLVYECKVCRNLFRSLANFISHKRVYCKESFSSSIHGHFLKETCSIQEVLKIRKLEESYQESLKEINESNGDKEDIDERIPISKDLTEIVEQIIKHKGVDEKMEEHELVFQKIPKTNVAVFQNIAKPGDDSNDSMQSQVKELDELLSQDNAVLQGDGSFKVQSNSLSTENVIQISDDEDNELAGLKCRICNLQFSTQKTLKFHMKYKHLESRLVYPCPDCLDIFSTSWSVYRHLFKVHRKTAAQIRRLRESIQSKAFRMNNPPAFYEKRKAAPKVSPQQKISEEERLEQENQAWLEQLDGEGEGRRCGGCGRAFERRAALAAHAHTCARRTRRRIQIQIRRDYHKNSHNPYLEPAPAPASNAEFTENAEEFEIKKEKTVNNNLSDDNEKPENENPEADESVMDVENDKTQKLTEEKDTEIEMQTDDSAVQEKPLFYDSTILYKLPYALQAEKSNVSALKQKMQPDTDIDSLLCKKCDSKFEKLAELLDHMAEHYKWMRYACKLCNFKHFTFDKLPEHVKVVHKLKGDSDFYYSTLKAIDGNEAKELAETTDESNEVSEVSLDSRRPSRCSSDSSRLSDDSSSSSTREVGSRKRKSNRYRNNIKKKKENIVTDDGEDSKDADTPKEINIDNDSSSNPKIFEESSSDLDDIEERTAKRVSLEVPTTLASRRPVRNKTKPKNQDFEYDLSNLLKLEAQGYRDSQTSSSKSTQVKKKPPDLQYNYDIINKECCGALMTMSRKSVENSKSHIKTINFFNAPKKVFPSVFARPLAPKIAKVDKISPRKDEKELKDGTNSVTVSPNLSNVPKNISNTDNVESTSKDKSTKTEDDIIVLESNELPEPFPKISEPKSIKFTNVKSLSNIESTKSSEINTISDDVTLSIKDENKSGKSTEAVSVKDTDTPSSQITEIISIEDNEPNSDQNSDSKSVKDIVMNKKEDVNEKTTMDMFKNPKLPVDTIKPNKTIPLVPLKFRRQSMEVIKNPLIKKNMTDFTKAGMKTKILVIKPISRNGDGSQATPLKFQTIKLKDPIKSITPRDQEKKDQVVVVQIPSVDRVIRPNVICTTNAIAAKKPMEINSPIISAVSPDIEEVALNKTSVIKEAKSISDNEIVAIETFNESIATISDAEDIKNSSKIGNHTSYSIESDETSCELFTDLEKPENIEV